MAMVKAVTEPVWLGEGPHWDANEQALFFVSIFDSSVHKYSPLVGGHSSSLLGKLDNKFPNPYSQASFYIFVMVAICNLYWLM